MPRDIPIPLAKDVHLPEDLRGVANGAINAIPLAPCGVFSTHHASLELTMHHLAADAMRAMVAVICEKFKLERVRADNSIRNFDRQVRMFDGTLPKDRSGVDGRYIPEHLWPTMPAGSLLDKRKNWKDIDWRRRKGTEECSTPGFSNHGLGLAIDLVIGDHPDMYDWLVDNAARFGFSGETKSEKYHWRYIAGDHVPEALVVTVPTRVPGRREPRIPEDPDMQVLDLAAGSAAFTRVVVAGRIKWVRGPAAAAIDRMNLQRLDVSRQELIDLMRTFGTEGTSPFATTRAPQAADAELDVHWQENLAASA